MKKTSYILATTAITITTLVGCGSATTDTTKTENNTITVQTEDNSASNTVTVEESSATNKDVPTAESTVASNTSTTTSSFTFSADTFTDTPFTEADLAAYDITMVNYWETWCPPCLAEMPALQILSQNLPAGSNMITICGDSLAETELAQEVIDQNQLTFPVLKPTQELFDAWLSEIQSIPTTFFVDKNGTIIGKPHVGLPANTEEDIVAAYTTLIEDAIAATKE